MSRWPSRFDEFAAAIDERRRKGARVYGDRCLSAEPRLPLEEIRDELQGVSGWALVLNCRLARIERTLERADRVRREAHDSAIGAREIR